MIERFIFYEVGGSVRNKLLGLEHLPTDIDYTAVVVPKTGINLEDIDIAKAFQQLEQFLIESSYEPVLVQEQYLTIKALDINRRPLDFVLARKDGVYKDGRRPETVTLGTLLDDLTRRDFTMNAIALNEKGYLIDPFDGLVHLGTKELDTVLEPKTVFDQDGLRLLRMIRFQFIFDLRLSYRLRAFVKQLRDFDALLKGVSKERMYEEFMKMVKHDPRAIIFLIKNYEELLHYIFDTTSISFIPSVRKL